MTSSYVPFFSPHPATKPLIFTANNIFEMSSKYKLCMCFH